MIINDAIARFFGHPHSNTVDGLCEGHFGIVNPISIVPVPSQVVARLRHRCLCLRGLIGNASTNGLNTWKNIDFPEAETNTTQKVKKT